MWKIGLTGSIGSGKSLVASLFAEMGVPVYHADEEAKRFYIYPLVLRKMRDHFGDSIFNEAGGINKAGLAEIVFSQPSELAWLNSLIHPMVKMDFDCWCNLYQSYPYVLHEAAIIFESQFEDNFDRTILVTAPEVLRVKRVMQRDSVTAEDVLRRMAHQWPEEKKSAMADYMINNDERSLLLPQITALHLRLSDLS